MRTLGIALAFWAGIWWADLGRYLAPVAMLIHVLDFLIRRVYYLPPTPLRAQDGEYAVVTGASRGIGKAMAEELASRGWSVALVARSRDAIESLSKKLEETYKVGCVAISADLAREEGVATVVKRLKEEKLRVSLLVNNAGVSSRDHLATVSVSKMETMLNLNVLGTTRLTRALLSKMLAQRRGRVLFVSSITGISPQPCQAVYAATKAYISQFCASLRFELRNSGVQVSCICPGATVTNFAQESGLEESLIFRIPTLQSSATYVAKVGVDTVLCDHPMVITGWFSYVAWYCGWLFPEAIISWIACVFWLDAGDAWKMLTLQDRGSSGSRSSKDSVDDDSKK
mmetsp:Transcript_20880/g.39189  ORF Transcript_20880/g.39189 Transcript_20880/m.39189 type:complete len:342 (-) Transcript_20880:1477-2502(-)